MKCVRFNSSVKIIETSLTFIEQLIHINHQAFSKQFKNRLEVYIFEQISRQIKLNSRQQQSMKQISIKKCVNKLFF